MPVTPHYACQEPNPDAIICRFMDMPKFRDLLANEELYFRRDDLLKALDPEEGLATDDYMRRSLRLIKYDLNDERTLNDQQAFSRQISECRYVQCWQLFEGETLDMWYRYTGGSGVAIFTQFSILKEILDSLIDDITVGCVKYGDEHERHNLIDFLFTKRKHFDKEREVRIVLSSYDPSGGANRHIDAEGYPRREPLDEENPLHEWVHDHKRRRIHLKTLLTEVCCSPWITDAEAKEVSEWMKIKQFDCPVKPSELTSALTPTAEEFKRAAQLS